MLFSLVFSKLVEWLFYRLLAKSCYRAARKMKNYITFFRLAFRLFPTTPSHQQIPASTYPNLTQARLQNLDCKALVCDLNALLQNSSAHSFFPYFMLIAFEGGSMIRALLLLISYPFLCLLDYESRLRVMILITFCGLRVEVMDCVSRAVLPKFYLENLDALVYQVLVSAKSKVIVTKVPGVMVHWFMKEYLGVDQVIGTELGRIGSFYTGFVSNESGVITKHRAIKGYFGDEMPDVGVGVSSCLYDDHDQLYLSLCKEAYVINNREGTKGNNSTVATQLPRSKYPKPLIFHDGRLAFLPTPLATLSMFIWLPLGIFLSIFRLLTGILLPYNVAVMLGTFTGVTLRFTEEDTHRHHYLRNGSGAKPKGVLYVCNHRTLLDPVMLGLALAKPLTAVTYSLSKMSEMIAPLKTVRLTRDRHRDGEKMQKLLSQGDLVVCPEGTTCREPYLLRFSSLFAELADDIFPVAVSTDVQMFYGTTASGFKCFDPFFFLMNPRPTYYIHVLDKVPKQQTTAGGKSSFEVANSIQGQLGNALGFECTNLTRRDKYLMLAGNEGIVENKNTKC